MPESLTQQRLNCELLPRNNMLKGTKWKITYLFIVYVFHFFWDIVLCCYKMKVESINKGERVAQFDCQLMFDYHFGKYIPNPLSFQKKKKWNEHREQKKMIPNIFAMNNISSSSSSSFTLLLQQICLPGDRTLTFNFELYCAHLVIFFSLLFFMVTLHIYIFLVLLFLA